MFKNIFFAKNCYRKIILKKKNILYKKFFKNMFIGSKIALENIYFLYMKVLYVHNLIVKNLVRRRKID